eukprot:CAMPEP_0170285128 /NCGR_PEP_ID=MMETSP0116_2-20130129/42609_1 /TAXON_ID=400756 /ORGANISM="Durinskia baltica, Strain CSIRO CS-38" /LENGTH=47 /DNA_ID= /DNA_START= /DNA_END= /DNA_ORIENTATION=
MASALSFADTGLRGRRNRRPGFAPIRLREALAGKSPVRAGWHTSRLD